MLPFLPHYTQHSGTTATLYKCIATADKGEVENIGINSPRSAPRGVMDRKYSSHYDSIKGCSKWVLKRLMWLFLSLSLSVFISLELVVELWTVGVV